MPICPVSPRRDALGKSAPLTVRQTDAGPVANVIATLHELAGNCETPHNLPLLWCWRIAKSAWQSAGADTPDQLDDVLGGVGWTLDPSEAAPG